ncbi:hypothetical protein E2C01_088656 [Portunus trituberculatus]|uniref:Ig-like domain-containing protein n=1 Tax=Portunus trituberculatus TaxID=210409 RepID=A0A5B7JMH1_PORTR|nr:hypothetical protein [Portunus trituberculatus]
MTGGKGRWRVEVGVPKVKILPMGDRYVKAGSTVRIDCQITDVVQLPDYIFWYHQEKRVMARHDPNLTVSTSRYSSLLVIFILHSVPSSCNVPPYLSLYYLHGSSLCFFFSFFSDLCCIFCPPFS